MTRATFRPVRLLACFGALAFLVGATADRAAGGVDRPPDPDAFLERVASVWTARDLPAWLSLWDLPPGDERAREQDLAREAFAGDETVLRFLTRPQPASAASRFAVDAQVFTVSEPDARIAFWRLTVERRADGWALVARSQESAVDGLVHLSIGAVAWRVENASLRLEDFELRMEDGTLFSGPESLGHTALVFVGRGRVRFRPRPKAEGEQLRKFAGSQALDRAVEWAFVRMHPAEFRRVVETERLQPETASAAGLAQARRVFLERSPRSFVLETDLPRSPWWLMPGLGDAVVDFPWKRGRVLTFAISSADAENVNLFERDRQIQICMYPSAGRPRRADVDERNAFDLLDQALAVRFEPERAELSGVQTMSLRPLAGSSTLRLRLHDELRVSSIRTSDGKGVLFFRVRDQGTVVVSLGTLAVPGEPLTLVVRYAGRHDPAPVEQEVVQLAPVDDNVVEQLMLDQRTFVYSNRTAWYPRLPHEDFAPASVSLDTPESWLGVTGGEMVSLRTEAKRTRTEFRLAQPGKFLTAVVGRLSDLGRRELEGQSLRGFASPRMRGADGFEQMELAERILRFYRGLFGPCPYPSIALTLTEANVPGGHSPPGLVYVQRRSLLLRGRGLADDPAGFPDLPEFVLAHELAHQWWGQGTAPASYRERWLSEGWAQYAAALWIREQRGEAAFRGMMDRMARWAHRHDGKGPIHLGQRLGMLEQDPRIFRAVVYDKGAWVLHMLRGIVGEEAFLRGARALLESQRFGKIATDDLRQALERESGRDLSAYFERWIYDTGLPTILWSARSQPSADGVRTIVEARSEGAPGPLPLEVSLSTPRGTKTLRVTVQPSRASWTLDTEQPTGRVALNADRGLLARVKRVARVAERPAR